MPGMILLQKKFLEGFKRFLDDKDLAYRDGKGEWQVLQVCTPDRGWQVLFKRKDMPHHFTANEALRPLIEEFKGDR